MATINNDFEPLKDYTDKQILEIAKSIDSIEKEEARILKEQLEDKERKLLKNNSLIRVKKSPVEIINRLLLILFLGSFLFSFVSIYTISPAWFLWYVISAFASILYTPNRKALKELLDAWPNIINLIQGHKNNE